MQRKTGNSQNECSIFFRILELIDFIFFCFMVFKIIQLTFIYLSDKNDCWIKAELVDYSIKLPLVLLITGFGYLVFCSLILCLRKELGNPLKERIVSILNPL